MSQELKNLARRIAEKRGLDPELFVRLIQTESNFDPNARGAAGEIGLGQILPTTNADPGYGVKSAIDLLDPVDNSNLFKLPSIPSFNPFWGAKHDKEDEKLQFKHVEKILNNKK